MSCKYDFMSVDKVIMKECKNFFGKFDIDNFYRKMFDELDKRMNIYDLEPPEEMGCSGKGCYGRKMNQLQFVITSLLDAALDEALITNHLLITILKKKGNLKDGESIEREKWNKRVNADDMRWARQYIADSISDFFGWENLKEFYSAMFEEIGAIIPISDMDIGNDDSPVHIVMAIIEKDIELYTGIGVYAPVLIKAEIEHRKKEKNARIHQ